MKKARKATESKSRGFKYSDLPITLRREIDKVIEMRKLMGLFDDSVERKERALRYYVKFK